MSEPIHMSDAEAVNRTGDDDDERIVVRAYVPADRAEVERLLHEGLLPGHVDYSPGEADRIREQMMAGRQRFWVAEVEGRVVGTLAMIEAGPAVAHLHWLRVDPAYQAAAAVARRLRLAAGAFAREMGVLKLVLQAPADVEQRVVDVYRQAGFRFSRARDRQGRHLLEFYLNLYERPRPPGETTPKP